MTASTNPLDARLRATLASVAVSGAVLVVAALAFLGPRAAGSVAIGAALAGGNLWALARIVSALLPGPTANGGAAAGALSWTVLAGCKMIGLFAVAWLLMKGAFVSPIPMLAGFAALPLGIAIGSIVSDRSIRGEP